MRVQGGEKAGCGLRESGQDGPPEEGDICTKTRSLWLFGGKYSSQRNGRAKAQSWEWTWSV